MSNSLTLRFAVIISIILALIFGTFFLYVFIAYGLDYLFQFFSNESKHLQKYAMRCQEQVKDIKFPVKKENFFSENQ
jgi:hypothetical protein